jgi:hypothetical protein
MYVQFERLMPCTCILNQIALKLIAHSLFGRITSSSNELFLAGLLIQLYQKL